MAMNNVVENKEREENKKGLIIFIIVLILLLALFIGIRALSDKKDNKEEENEQPIEDVVDKEEEDEDETTEEESTYVYTPTKSNTVTKTKNEVKEEEKTEVEQDTLTLRLNGSNVVYVDYASTYIDEGAYAIDTKDGDLSISIVKTIYLDGSVVDQIDTTNENATYTIKYVVTNSRGETKEVERTVIIRAPESSEVILTLNGNKEEKIEYNVSNPTVYTDLGATASVSGGESIPVTTSITLDGSAYTGEISSEAKGTYVITYTASYNGKDYSIARTVVVADTTAPVIATASDEYKYLVDTENPDTEITLEEIEKLFTVTDEDSNITNILTDEENIELTTNISLATEGEYKVVLTSTDSSNNTSSKTITIKVMEDTEVPEVLLTDNSYIDQTFYQFEITATDDYSDSENMTYSYAIVEDPTNLEAAVWNELTGNTFTMDKAEINSPTAVTRYVVGKATDEAGNESMSKNIIEVFIEP